MNLPHRTLILAAQSPLGWTPWWGLRPKPGQPMRWSAVVVQSLTAFFVVGFLLHALLWLTLGTRDLEALMVGGLLGALARGLWFLMVRAAWNTHLDHPPAEPVSATWRTSLAGLAFRLTSLGTAVALVYGVENLRGTLALQSLNAELQARGNPMTLDSVIPAPVPDDQNFAMAPLIKPALDIEYPPNPLKKNPSEQTTIRWRDPEGWKRAQSMLPIGSTQPKQSLEAFQVATNAGGGHARPPRDIRLSQNASVQSYVGGNRLPLATYQAYYRWLPDWPKPPEPGSPGRDVLIGLSASDADVKELMELAHQRPLSRFPLAYERGPATLLPHLAALKRMTSHLQLRAVAHLAEGQSDQALACVQLALRLSDLLQDEPILISHLVRIAMDRLTIQPIWEGCLDRRWTEAQLEALQAVLGRRDYVAEYLRVIPGEGALARITYDALMVHPRLVEGLGPSDGEDNSSGWVIFAEWAPRGWIRRNLVTHLRVLDTYLGHVKGATALGKDAGMDQTILNLNSKSRLDTAIAGRLLPVFSVRRTAEGEAWRRLALVGLALERHFRAHGSYPESLDALTPKFLGAIPADPMTGKPLAYRRLADGQFQLYSLGTDGHDDGGARYQRGKGASPDLGDLVWR